MSCLTCDGFGVFATCPSSALIVTLSNKNHDLLLLLLWQKVPQRQIVHNILNIFDPVLEPIATATQAVVLQVEDLEASEQVLDELVDQQGTLVITECDGIACKTGL